MIFTRARVSLALLSLRKNLDKGPNYLTVQIEMEKEQEKWHWEKRPYPFFEKTFIFFSYRIVIDRQHIWFLRVLSKISEKTLFFSMILSSIPEAVD